ncbi:ribonuclease R [Rubrivirga sp.]|uniref:ribonuclease R n=1 Tax=Rubrivirga sp. TaxID=1885344 RepID=UPI003C761CF7
MADDRAADALREQVLTFLSKHPDRAYRAKEISKTLGIKNNGRYQTLLEVVDGLRDSGQVDRANGGRIQHRGPQNEAVGVLSVAQQGFGFVKTDDDKEFFVRPRRMRTALHGDRVRVGLAAQKRNQPSDQKREAEVLEVVERGRTQTVGTFSTTGKSGWVVPDDKRIHHDVYVNRDDWNGATPGDKVVVTIDRFEDPKAAPEGTVVSILGKADAPGVDVLALAIAHGAPSDFPIEVENAAQQIKPGITKKEVARRLDLRDALVFTIDPEDAEDFDDAIHTRDLGHGMTEIGVHIADVSHYVPEGKTIDLEAVDRATSTYLVDRVIPMLPEALSNGVCSLRPREDKLAYSCIMAVDGGGHVHSWDIVETVIHSKERFTYDGAQAVLDGESHDLEDEVRRAGDLATTLTKKRMSEGAIDFDVPEVRVKLDVDGQPVDVYEKERKPANRLIEEFMLLANQAVAKEASKRGVPFVYRVHEPPDRERIQTLADFVKPFGHKLPNTEGEVKRSDLNKLLKSVKGSPEAPIIEQAAIRSMSKAVYSPDNEGHYGLGFEHYAHFTSPIRRYPDLIAHRILKRMQDQAKGKIPTVETLEELSEHCSAREREAAEAERESVKLKQVEYAAQHLGDEFDGVVVGVTKFGVFVQMRPLLVEGLVHVRGMDGYWEYDDRRYVLVSKDSGRRIQVGAPCRVKIEAAEPETRKVDLAFVELPGAEDRSERRSSGAKSRRDKRKTRGTRKKGGNKRRR